MPFQLSNTTSNGLGSTHDWRYNNVGPIIFYVNATNLDLVFSKQQKIWIS
jgi:hypothetical protein